MPKCQCQPQIGCRPAGRCCHGRSHWNAPTKRKKHRPPRPPESPGQQAHGQAEHRPGLPGPRSRAGGPIKHQLGPPPALRIGLGVGPCIKGTGGRNHARATHENKQDTCNCRAAMPLPGPAGRRLHMHPGASFYSSSRFRIWRSRGLQTQQLPTGTGHAWVWHAVTAVNGRRVAGNNVNTATASSTSKQYTPAPAGRQNVYVSVPVGRW